MEAEQSTAADLNMTEASAADIKAAVEIMDDWDESDRAKVNPIVGQAGVAAGAGAVGVTVPRVTVASDDPLLVEVQDSLSDYYFSGFLKDGKIEYASYEDKAGNYYVQKYDKSTKDEGVATYSKGTGGVPAIGSLSGLSYASFASTF